MSIKAARLDENNLFVCIDELADEQALTERHLPQIKECDLPAGAYEWVPSANEYGGAFWPKDWLVRKAATEQEAAADQAAAIAERLARLIEQAAERREQRSNERVSARAAKQRTDKP